MQVLLGKNTHSLGIGGLVVGCLLHTPRGIWTLQLVYAALLWTGEGNQNTRRNPKKHRENILIPCKRIEPLNLEMRVHRANHYTTITPFAQVVFSR